MSALKWLLLILLVNPLMATADALDEGESEVNPARRLQTIRNRYKDFYQRQTELETERRLLETGIPEVKSERERDQKERERALKDFLANRKRETMDPRLERMHDLEVKAEKEQMEVWRKRYVQVRDQIQETESKGIKIPEKKEYELED